jgi:signal transduction histidine kinase/ligand-binding sensor domain-containing protein
MLSRWAGVVGAVLLLGTPLSGIDRDLRIDQMHHTSWTHKDGVPTQIQALAQTTDGFLWIGDLTGLYRFDGLTFELYRPPAGQSLPKASVFRLFAVPDGGLWIGFNLGGVSFLKDGKITTYLDNEANTLDLAGDQQGVIWRARGPLGITRFVGSRWETLGPEWDPPAAADQLYVDHAGTLWVDTYHGLVYLPKGGRKFQKPADLAFSTGPFAESRSGTLWFLDIQLFDRTPKVAKIHPAGGKPIPWPFDGRPNILKTIVDEAGSLWFGTEGQGIKRIRYPERADVRNSKGARDSVDVFRQKDGLSRDGVETLFEAREGDVWVATNAGLDRFRESPLVTVGLPPDTRGFTLSARDNGGVWITSIAGKDNFFEVRDGKAIVLKPLHSRVYCSYRDPDGTTWFGTQDGILRLANNKVEKIDSPESPAILLTKDGAGRLVGSFSGQGLLRLENGSWAHLALPGAPTHGGTILFSDSVGRVWQGYMNNVTAYLDGDKVRVFGAKEGVTVGHTATIAGRNGGIWIGGDGGLEQFDGHRFVNVAPADGSAFGNVIGVVATADEGLWLGETRGIIHIAEAETRRLEQDPRYRVKYHVFDILDGLSNGLQLNFPRPNMIEGTDGRLWFATAQGVVWLDPKRIPRKPLPPTPAILSVTANGHTYGLPAPAEINLPARTVNLQFAYTAPSLAIPERVRYRYKLDGSDKEWRDAGSEREASYTNLGPGSYRFHVIASNSDGVWNKAEAVTAFVILPAYFQTHWFYALCVCAMLILLWELYRLRLRQVSGQLSAQIQSGMEARLAERTRIARELHDTLLQGFQGLTLHLQAVMEQIPDKEPARQSMKKALTYADGVLLEGRQRVRDLRPEGSDIHELSQQIAAYGEELAKDSAIAFKVTVVGAPEPLHPVVGDETYRIAREALTNAFRHAQASKIEVEITYDAESVSVRVRDNGAGIGLGILESGKQGHWGLSGMRERAHHIGGQLNILSNPGSGTEVDLSLPAKVAFVRAPKLRRWYWFSRNKSGGR